MADAGRTRRSSVSPCPLSSPCIVVPFSFLSYPFFFLFLSMSLFFFSFLSCPCFVSFFSLSCFSLISFLLLSYPCFVSFLFLFCFFLIHFYLFLIPVLFLCYPFFCFFLLGLHFCGSRIRFPMDICLFVCLLCFCNINLYWCRLMIHVVSMIIVRSV